MKSPAALLLVLWWALANPGFAAPPKKGDTLSKIRASGVIVVGHATASIPFSYLPAPSAPPIGYSLSICLRIIEALKQKVLPRPLRTQYRPVDGDSGLALLSNGIIDMECGASIDTPAARKQVDFSRAIFVAATRVAVAKGGPVRSLRDLGGRRIAVTGGSTDEQALELFARNQKLSIELLRGRDGNASYAALSVGKADAVAMDDILIVRHIAEFGDQKRIEFVDGALSSETYAIMIRKDDTEFKAIVDKSIEDLIDQGALAKLYLQWFRSPIPPKRVNLALPFTEEMAKVLKLVR